ncbi:MAG: nucleotidyl transferase AbiEii/AbiGii toxin family protein, partial [Candidatus Latescibacteria bacterium]|nr:nucleotidyl transferase AbiEii/AbiGii toxin family protein [Candidatus Latescibacterota bacterium]
INMQIDIGFGDPIYPKPTKNKLPSILDFPAPALYCYSKESAIAEKFEAIFKLGLLNSRIKDFYDIWILSRQFAFSLSTLSKAVDKTFKQRGTTISKPIAAFSEEFISSRQSMWKAFRKRLRQDHLPESFHEIVTSISEFMEPVIKRKTADIRWTVKGKWSRYFIS